MKKFELTTETKTLPNGIVLYRIRALVRLDLGHLTVEIGELGGWVEKEENLSNDGNAWVFDEAMVFGNARVFGNASVFDEAMVFGNASVFDEAMVFGNARVFDEAMVFGNARVSKTTHYFIMGPIGSRNDFITFFRCEDGTIKVRCGCFLGTIAEFLAKVSQTHGDSKHAKVYRAAVETALIQMEGEL